MNWRELRLAIPLISKPTYVGLSDAKLVLIPFSFATGGEEGYVRLHQFDPEYADLDWKFVHILSDLLLIFVMPSDFAWNSLPFLCYEGWDNIQLDLTRILKITIILISGIHYSEIGKRSVKFVMLPWGNFVISTRDLESLGIFVNCLSNIWNKNMVERVHS